MHEIIRRDPVFILVVVIGLMAGYKQLEGSIKEQEAWNKFKVAHSCQTVSAIAWRCDDGKLYYHQGEY